MKYKTTSVLGAFLFVGIILWTITAGYAPAQTASKDKVPKRTFLEIMRRFEAKDIDFAFPSRTIYLANDDKRQLKLKMLNAQKF